MKITVIFLLIAVFFTTPSNGQNSDRARILRKGYKEFETGFKSKFKVYKQSQKEHLVNAKTLLSEAIEKYPDGWENIIERLYLSTTELLLGNKVEAKRHCDLILMSQFCYDLDVIYGDNEKGLLWYVIKEIYLDVKKCKPEDSFLKLFRVQDYKKYYEYRDDEYEKRLKNPGYEICFTINPYGEEDKLTDIPKLYYCLGDLESSIKWFGLKLKVSVVNKDLLSDRQESYIHVLKEKYSKEEIEYELEESIKSLTLKGTRWNMMFFNNEILISDWIEGEKFTKWSTKFKDEDLTINESKDRMIELFRETKFYNKLRE